MESCGDRSALHGLEERLFKLVSRKATSAQWAEWLRAPLEHALAGGDKHLVLSLLKAGANGGAGWKGCDGRTLLDAAAEGGSEVAVSALLDAGARADMDAVSGVKGVTALHRACKGGHTAAAQALLVEGADVGLIDRDQHNALHYALQGGHEELAKRVTLAGADYSATNISGDTPLLLAATRGFDRFVSTLLRKGVDVDFANSNGQRPLHKAIENGSITVAGVLLKAGANPNLRYDGAGVKRECSPLFLARNSLAMTRLLLKHGAYVNSLDGIGFTALHRAARSSTPGVIDALVRAGADLEARSAGVSFTGKYHKLQFRGFTPLHVAAKYHNLETMAALLHEGANIHARDNKGLTPLHVVCKVSVEEPYWARKSADLLVRRGANETTTDNDGHMPADLIEKSPSAGRLRRLLANAPADRTWRRRGMLVICRAHSAKLLVGVGGGRAGKALCRGSGAGAGPAAGGGRGDESGCILTRVVGIEDEEVFKIIVGFL